MITKHDGQLGTLIHDVAHLLRLHIDQRLKPLNLTRAKWLAMGILADNPGLTQAQLAARLELGQANTGRMVDRLQQRGYVHRKKNRADRRSYHLFITDHAEHVLQQLAQLGSELEQTLLHDMPPGDIRILHATLAALKRRLIYPD